ncbi:MAG: polysaccharide lyase 6 family protein [Planctomycetota bacterium]
MTRLILMTISCLWWIAAPYQLQISNAADSESSEIFQVETAEQVGELLKTNALAPGDTIVWLCGNYQDIELNVEGIDGLQNQPITLRAESPGAVILEGETQFSIGAQHWVISGFHFRGREDSTNAYNTFQFRSKGGTAAKHVRLTDCAFTDLHTSETTSKWVLLFGQNNTIDHCHFSGKNSRGALVTVELAYLTQSDVAGHTIFRNYFGSVAPSEGNDNETIRIGSSADQNKSGGCSVVENCFYSCDGENEIISNKSSYNEYLRNTFRRCNGALVLRHGHHARVEGNFFFADGAENAGGIRISDSHHVIMNNYLQDLSGTGWNASLSVIGGSELSGGQSNGYQRVEDLSVAHNSILNCRSSVLFNDAKGERPPQGIFANNLIVSSNGPLIDLKLPATEITWVGNLMHGPSTNSQLIAISGDPELTESNGLLRPSSRGTAADAALDCGIEVRLDIDGQLRPESGADVGADEFSGESGEVVFAPLMPADVGVSFPIQTQKER